MAEAVSSREITLTRIFDAPREVVFDMWVDPEHLARWWGPDDFGVSHAESDPVTGGKLLIVMVGPDNFNQPMQATYREVVRPEKIIVDSVVPGPDGDPFIKSSHTVTFVDLGSKTEMTVNAKASVYRPEGLAALAGMKAGWTQSLQCLDDALTGADERRIVVTRLFDATPDKVFAMWSDVAHLEQWWGPDGFSISVDSFEMRQGGIWKFTMHGPDGTDYPNTNRFEEIVPNERLVLLHGEPTDPDPQFTFVAMFEAMGEQTAFSLRLVFNSKADRDAVAERRDAEEGAHQTLARLAAHLPPTP